MADIIVAGTSKFHIYSSFTLSSDDHASLALLYAPLIGTDAFSLYEVFSALLERDNLRSEEMIHQDLFDLYSLKPLAFMESRVKLEGIGLLNTYEKNGEYIYVLCPPLSPKNFIKDTTYGLYLYSKVRKELFYSIKKHFEIEKPMTDEYENITKSFDEVFSSRVMKDSTYEKFGYILGRTPGSNLKIKNSDFDFEEFVKSINTEFIEGGVSQSFKKQIIDLAYVYNFNERNMANLYNDSINKNNYFDYRILKKKANALFVYLRNEEAPKLVTRGQDYETNDLVSWIEEVSPEELLQTKMETVPVKYLETVNSIYQSIDNLPRGVLNCMILKALNDKSGELPNLTYFRKMSTSWVAANVLETKDALEYITTMAAPKKNIKSTKNIESVNKTKIEWEEL